MTPRPAPPRPRRRRRTAFAALAAAVALLGACSGDDGDTPPATTATTTPAPSTTTTAAPLEAGEQRYAYSPEVGDCFDRRTLPEEQGGEEIVLLLDCDLPHEVEVFAVLTIDPAAVPQPSTTTTTSAPPVPAGDEPAVSDEDGDTATTETTTAGAGSGTGTTSTTGDADAVGGAVDDPAEEGEQEGDDEAVGTTSTTGPDPELWPGDDSLIRYARAECPKRYGEWSGLPYEHSALEVGWLLPDEASWNDGDRTMACTVYDPSGTLEAPARTSGSTRGAGR